MKYTVCQTCGKEVMIRNGMYHDVIFPNEEHPKGLMREHKCPGRKVVKTSIEGTA
jgi:hypothetical protein